MFVFRKIWRALFSCNARFEIRPFDLLPTIYTPLEVLPFSLREEFLNMEFFLARFHTFFSSPYFPYSVQIRENTAQKKLLI